MFGHILAMCSQHIFTWGAQIYATAAEAMAASSGSTLAAAATSAALSAPVAARSSVASEPARPSAKAVARPPAVSTTNATRGRKRSAGQSFQLSTSALAFDDCWDRCRKQGRYGCVRDVLGEMDTAQAGKSYRHIDENLPRWSKRYGWRAGEYKTGVSSFCGHQGGASAGAGCTAEAMADVYKHHNR